MTQSTITQAAEVSVQPTSTTEQQQDLISQAASAVQGQDQATVNYLESLVGEGKKYKTVEDLAKAKFYADEHIRKIEEENASMRVIESKIETVLEKLQASTGNTNTQGTNEGHGNSGNPTPQASPTPSTSVESTNLEEELEKLLAKKEAVKQQSINKDTALNKLSEVYGDSDKALKAIAKVAFDKDGKRKEAIANMIDHLSINDPDELVTFITKMVDKNDVVSITPGATDGGTATHTVPNGSGTFTWSYAKKVRKENPALYNSTEFNDKLYAAIQRAESLGVDFYST